MRIGRRRFIAQASAVAAAAAATVMADAPSVIAQPKVQWRMSTAWPKQLDVMQGLARRLAQVVEEMSGGRFQIEVFPSGQIMKAFECFDATSKGTIEAFMGTASYWAPRSRTRDAVVHVHSVRDGSAGHGVLVLPGRRSQAHGGDVRPLQRGAASGPVVRAADGRLVQEEDQHDRRLQGTPDADRGPRRDWSSPRPAAPPSSRRPATSSGPSSAASSTRASGSGRTTT